jgi:hypothetical protein
MNTCRLFDASSSSLASQKSRSEKQSTHYLTVHEGLNVRLDRSSTPSVFSLFDRSPDWIIYTDITGT